MRKKAKKFFKKNQLEVIIVLTLFILAFGIRTVPSDKFPNIYGFDSFWAARMTKYMLDGSHPGWPFQAVKDIATDYPWGRANIHPVELGWWAVNAVIYKIAGGGIPWDYNLFGKIASWTTVILASLAIPAVYLFGKNAFNRMTGLASALFLTVSGNHLFYSIYGHAENDGFGLSLFFLTLFSFVMTVKKKSWKYGFLNMILFAWLSLVWQSYTVVTLLVSGTIGLYFITYYIMKLIKNYKESTERKEHRKWMIYALITIIPSILINYLFIGKTGFGLTVSLPLITAIIISLIIEKVTTKEQIEIKKENFYVKTGATTIIFLILATLIYGTAIATAPLNYVGFNMLGEQKQSLPYEKRMMSTIAEQNPVPGNNFFERIGNLVGNFGLSIWLAVISIILILAKLSIMPFIRKDFTYEWDILAVAFLTFSLYTLTSKAITMFFLAGVVAFGTGYFFGFLYSLIEYTKNNLKGKEKALKAGLFLILILSFSAYSLPGIQQVNNTGYDMPQEWIQTYSFLNTLPKGSVITAWWDYGHWMNYFSGDNIYTTQDNIQDRKDIIYTVASAFTHVTSCTQDNSGVITCDSTPEALEQEEVESLSLLKPLKTNYILIDKEIVAGQTGGKYGALKRIAGVETGCIQEFNCKQQEDNSTACNLGYINTKQGQEPIYFQFTEQQWNQLTNITWPGQTIAMPVITSQGQQVAQIPTRYFAKNMNSSGRTLYATALNCGNYFFSKQGANSNSPALYSFEMRLFFNDPSLKHVTKVFDNGWNVIYKVNWNGIPDPEKYDTWTKTHSVLCTGEAKKICEESDYKTGQ